MKNFWIYNGRLEAAPGASIGPTIAEAIELAATAEHGPIVMFDFNHVTVTVAADSNATLVEREWWRALRGFIEKRVGPHPAAELTSDEKASDAAKQAEHDRIEAERAAAWEQKERLKREASEASLTDAAPIALRDPAAWQSWLEANKDGYGGAVMNYAERWARMMQVEMARGAVLSDVATRLSHEADLEGITGFMYGAAVSVLSQCWEHGEALRRWHNLSTQIGDEGEKANESGGVINPALMSIGT